MKKSTRKTSTRQTKPKWVTSRRGNGHRTELQTQTETSVLTSRTSELLMTGSRPQRRIPVKNLWATSHLTVELQITGREPNKKLGLVHETQMCKRRARILNQGVNQSSSNRVVRWIKYLRLIRTRRFKSAILPPTTAEAWRQHLTSITLQISAPISQAKT